MPLSTNAPFNQQGHAETLRDIEYLYLKVQELFRVTGINDGDLNPGGGVGVGQDVADDGWGTASAASSDTAQNGVGSSAEYSFTPGASQVIATGSTAWPVTAFNTPFALNSLAGFDPTTGIFTAPVDGLYAFSATLGYSVTGTVSGLVGLGFSIASTGGVVGQLRYVTAAAVNDQMAAAAVVPLKAGDGVALLAANSTGVAATMAGNGAWGNLLAISRIA